MDTATPAFAPETMPPAWYSEPGIWQTERREAFAKSWQYAAHVSALPEPNSWIAQTLAGYPIVLVRDETGALRGFHNMCRHRAGPLTSGSSGVCDGALTCQYHGWRYTLDGRLRSARDFGPAANFDTRDFGLIPVRVEVWRGLIFVAISTEAPALTSLLAPLDARLGDTDWSDHVTAMQRSHEIACNWKTYVENYLEGYHVPTLHPSLDAEVDSAHYVVRVEGRVAIHEVPMRSPDPVYDGLWAWAWPNIGFNIYRRGLMIERMSPLGPNRTRLDYDYLMPPGEIVSEETLTMSNAVTAEDIWIAERVQENLDAGIYSVGHLSPRHEGGVAAFQSFVRTALGA